MAPGSEAVVTESAGRIVIERLAVAVADVESVTWTVNVEPPADGTPLMPPVWASKLSPAGSAPAEIAQV